MNPPAEKPNRKSADAGASSGFGARIRSLASHPTLRVALVGALLMWGALPPLGLGFLGWIAPVPWLWLARQPELRGRRPYRAIWFSAFVFWLGILHWLRLPHWATSFGWIALAFYMSLYTPAIVALVRYAARQFRISIVISAPIVWTAADQARAYLLSGFSMGSLCHSQYRWTSVIQTADLCGEFGVTFLMVLTAAAVARALPLGGGESNTRREDWRFIGLAAGIVAAMVGYGRWSLAIGDAAMEPGPKIALIQGSIDTEMKYDPNSSKNVYDHYMSLSQSAVAADPAVQLIVWPETMFPYSTMSLSEDVEPGPNDSWTIEVLRQGADLNQMAIATTAERLGRPLLIGIGAEQYTKGNVRRWNSALYTDAHGNHKGRYDKCHAVPFGEYTPFAETFPFLYNLTPLTGGIEEGKRAEAFDLSGTMLSPSICYETVLARVIRREVLELRGRGIEPDVLVNVTNDGWFWGSSELDLHLICGVFRAVECRKPLVIAANTGFSAHIDSAGRIVEQGPRREAGFIDAAVMLDHRRSPYLAGGDWLANGCVIAASFIAFAALADRCRKKRSAATF